MTAVEWLLEELRGTNENGDFIFNGVITLELIEQAKEMEREQTIEFAKACSTESAPDEYYQETYSQTFK